MGEKMKRIWDIDASIELLEDRMHDDKIHFFIFYIFGLFLLCFSILLPEPINMFGMIVGIGILIISNLFFVSLRTTMLLLYLKKQEVK